jgi:hypothetical protein
LPIHKSLKKCREEKLFHKILTIRENKGSVVEPHMFCLALTIGEKMFIPLTGLQLIHCIPLQNATISNMKSKNYEALQKWVKAITVAV